MSSWLYHDLSIYLAALGANCIQRQAHLERSTGKHCQTFKIGHPWTSDSPFTCFLLCMARFSENCQRIVYDAFTQTCTPGSAAFRPLKRVTTSIPTGESGDEIYFARQPLPTCDTSRGSFSVYQECGTTVCLALSQGSKQQKSTAKG